VSVASVKHRRRVGNISATRRRRVVGAFAMRRRYVCVLLRFGARCVALVGWQGEEMILKTSEAMERVRQGTGDASMTLGRRIGLASAMRCRIGDASAMRRAARDASRWLYGEVMK